MNKKYLLGVLLAAIMVFAGLKGSLVAEAATASDMISVASKEVGVSGTPNKYTQEFGPIGNTYSYAWCHAFVCWVANHSGSGSIIPRTALCQSGVTWFKNQGRWQARESGYVPVPGDIIYFNWNNDAKADHVGIVTYTSNGRVHTIEGNAKNAVKVDGGYKNGYAINSTDIMGYGRPAYSSAPQANPVPTDISGNNPIGNVDIVSGGQGTVRVAGWTFDRDVPSRSIGVHVYVGGPAGSGAPGYQITANRGRADVNNAYGISGNHGFDETINCSRTGSQTIYIYAINEGQGNDNPLIGQKTVVINKKPEPVYAPQGHIDIAGSESVGTIRVGGWAFDKDVPSQSIMVHVYVGGSAGSGAPGYVIKADKSRTDVNQAYGISGLHGFDQTIKVSKTGTQQLYFYAINEGGGSSNTLIGTKTVTIKAGEAPKGYVDIVSSPAAGKLRVAGWAFDKDVPSNSITIHVYVGGPAGSGAPAYAIKADTSRPDVNNAFGLSGNHGFDKTLDVSRRGTQTLYFYAINEGGGTGNPLFATKTVTIK